MPNRDAETEGGNISRGWCVHRAGIAGGNRLALWAEMYFHVIAVRWAVRRLAGRTQEGLPTQTNVGDGRRNGKMSRASTNGIFALLTRHEQDPGSPVIPEIAGLIASN